jgi:transmembrane sensor
MGNRTLRLSGEALFTVAHHEGKPFTVIAGPSTTRVLGTQFTVRHYTTDTAALVAVRNGKVAVQSTVLTGAQQVVVTPRAVGPIQRADRAAFSFATGILTLNSVPLSEAIVELDRWYDADIRLGDARLATWRLSGEYAAGSLADLTEFLEGTFNVRVVRAGRVLTLYPR